MDTCITASHIARKIQFERHYPQSNVHIVHDEFNNVGIVYHHDDGYCTLTIPASNHPLEPFVDTNEPIVLYRNGIAASYDTREAEYSNRKLVRSITYPEENIKRATDWTDRDKQEFRLTLPNEYAAMKAYSYAHDQHGGQAAFTHDFYSHSATERRAIKHALPCDAYQELFNTTELRDPTNVAKMLKYYRPTHATTRLSNRPLRACCIRYLKTIL